MDVEPTYNTSSHRGTFPISQGSGGRVERHRIQDLKSRVYFLQSVMIWGAMLSAGATPYHSKVCNRHNSPLFPFDSLPLQATSFVFHALYMEKSYRDHVFECRLVEVGRKLKSDCWWHERSSERSSKHFEAQGWLDLCVNVLLSLLSLAKDKRGCSWVLSDFLSSLSLSLPTYCPVPSMSQSWPSS